MQKILPLEYLLVLLPVGCKIRVTPSESIIVSIGFPDHGCYHEYMIAYASAYDLVCDWKRVDRFGYPEILITKMNKIERPFTKLDKLADLIKMHLLDSTEQNNGTITDIGFRVKSTSSNVLKSEKTAQVGISDSKTGVLGGQVGKPKVFSRDDFSPSGKTEPKWLTILYNIVSLLLFSLGMMLIVLTFLDTDLSKRAVIGCLMTGSIATTIGIILLVINRKRII